MKKTKFTLCFFNCDATVQLFSTSFELPNNVNPIEILSQLFVDYRLDFINYSQKTIKLIEGHDE